MPRRAASSEVAQRALDELITIAGEVSAPSTTEAMRSHPNPLFARLQMNAPAEVADVRAAALGALVTLARRAGDDNRATEELSAALRDGAGPVRAEAVRLACAIASLDVRTLADDPDAMVRAQVLGALGDRNDLAVDDPCLLDACAPEQPLALRATAVRIVRERPGVHTEAHRILREDPNVYIRAIAAAATPGS